MADSETKPAAAAVAAAPEVSETPETKTLPTVGTETPSAAPTAPSAPSAEPATAAPETLPAPAPIEAEKELPTSPETDLARLWKTAQSTGHPEIWGVTLADPATHVPSQIVLQKYLNANDGNFEKAKTQLINTLEWRAQTKPLELMKKIFNKTKFDGLGFVTTHTTDGAPATEPEGKEIFTWNIYGGVKSIEETFGSLDEFIEWRVALMEIALQELSLSTATKPITATEDPYKIFQVHDYKSISFLRSPPQVKSASAETIKVFAQNYPELLKEKFFVNVPVIMGFVYTFMKLFVAAKTIKKFHPMSNGGNLALEFGDSKVEGLGEQLPAEYGGKGLDLRTQGKEPLLE